jgi:uncharacterized delta-60 repeat protein
MSKSIIKTVTTAGLSAGRVRIVLGLAVITALVSTGLFARARANEDDIAPEAAGDLDPSFGTGGKGVSDFGVLASAANAIAIQGDGKLVIAGTIVLPTGNDFGVARLNPDGSLDKSFSGGGVTTDFSGGDDRGFAVAIQPDGKIVAAGAATTTKGGFDFGVARYNTDGTLDTGFGSGGKVTTDFNGKDDVVFSVVVMPDGRIAVAGFETRSDDTSVAAIAFYNPDGSLLGKGGFNDPANGNQVTAMALQPDGKLVIAGGATRGAGDDFVVARLNSDGSKDNNFGNNGGAYTDFGGNDDANSVAVQPDGKIVAAGATRGGGMAKFALARYNADGSLDSSFGSSGKVITSSLGTPAVAGKVITSSLGTPAVANVVLIQPDNKIVAVGFSAGAGSDFTLVRYNADGSVDSTFGSGGQVTTDFFGSDDAARAALIQPDGKIVAAGFATHTTGGPKEVAMARYLSGIAPDFSIGFDQPTVTADRGTKARVNVTINHIAGFTGNVTITPPAPSGGIKPKPADPITTSDSSAAFKLKIGASAAVGPQALTFTATDSSGKTRTATITLVVQ